MSFLQEPSFKPICCGQQSKWVVQTPSLHYFYCEVCKKEVSEKSADDGHPPQNRWLLPPRDIPCVPGAISHKFQVGDRARAVQGSYLYPLTGVIAVHRTCGLSHHDIYEILSDYPGDRHAGPPAAQSTAT